MKFIVITLFPEMFSGVLGESILKRGIEKGLFGVEFINLRDFGLGNRKQVDDTPYGGGAGMVLRVDVMSEALKAAKKLSKSKHPRVFLLTPQGKVFDQDKAKTSVEDFEDIILICGHYEGFDERIRALVDDEISLGKFVLTGGEIPAMAIIDSVARLIPGVLGKEESFQLETFSNENEIEHPQFTRPETWNNQRVPDVLLSGNHAEIEKWRKLSSAEKSKKYKK